jgi:hypothetical protein
VASRGGDKEHRTNTEASTYSGEQTRDVPAKIGVDASMLEQLLKGITGLKIAGMKRNDYGITKTGVSKIRSTTKEVREATGWGMPGGLHEYTSLVPVPRCLQG